MKHSILTLTLLTAIAALGQSVSLTWQYSSNALAYADTNGWPQYFHIRSFNTPVGNPSNWPTVYYQTVSNTPITGFDGTNYQFTVTNVVAPGQAFFVASISNIWGESGFSNTSSVPPLPLTLQTKIIKN